jgi:hypothetical protein
MHGGLAEHLPNISSPWLQTPVIPEILESKLWNSLKRSNDMIKLVSFLDARMVQYMELSKCNKACKENQGKQSCDHLNRYRKYAWQKFNIPS